MKNFCRFCGKKYENLQNIFHDIKLKDNTLKSPANLAKQIFNDIKFLSDSRLSNGICELCLNNLKICYDFYERILKSQYKLNEILNQQKYNDNKLLPILLPKEEKNSMNYVECNVNQSNSNIKRIYQCLECSDNFKSYRKINIHIEKLHTNKNICNYCNCYYPEENITQHIKTDHKNYQFFCRLCSEKFSTQRYLLKHYKTTHDYDLGCFYCTKCEYLQFSGRENLLQHIDQIHTTNNRNNVILPSETNTDQKNKIVDICSNIDQNEFVPPAQDELIMDVEFLDDFFLNQDENSFQFNDCWEALGLNFEDELKLKFSDLTNDTFINTDITETIKNENLYKCPRCNYEFSSQFKMFIHLAQIHNENCLVCSECGLKFNKFNEFIQHRKIHFREFFLSQQNDQQQKDEPIERIKNNKKIYECKHCKKVYTLKNNYLMHICTKSISKLGKIQCNFCNLQFSNIKEIYAHQKHEHSSNNTLQSCSLCDKQFKTLAGLKYHLKTHESIQSLVCPYCNKIFLAIVNLSAHIKAVHAVKKSHLCDLCDRQFATLDHLKKHVMSVHQKERNHLCSVCGSCFSQVSHLKQHSEIHKEKRKLQCEYCSKGFTRKIDMRRHFEKFHSNFF